MFFKRDFYFISISPLPYSIHTIAFNKDIHTKRPKCWVSEDSTCEIKWLFRCLYCCYNNWVNELWNVKGWNTKVHLPRSKCTLPFHNYTFVCWIATQHEMSSWPIKLVASARTGARGFTELLWSSKDLCSINNCWKWMLRLPAWKKKSLAWDMCGRRQKNVQKNSKTKPASVSHVCPWGFAPSAWVKLIDCHCRPAVIVYGLSVLCDFTFTPCRNC